MSGGLFFISDLHLGHALVHRLRAEKGLCPETEHDDVLAENWDSAISTGDQVWVLGDVLANKGREVERYALDWIHARPGTKHLIAGNHDPVFSGHRDCHSALSIARGWTAAFASIQSFARRRIAGQNVLLSHFPYPGTSEGIDEHGRPFDDRYAQYRLANLGLPLLHGHTHHAERVSWNRWAGWKKAPQFHVGLDAWNLEPVALHDLEELITDTLTKGN